jgi:hypothetical protein
MTATPFVCTTFNTLLAVTAQSLLTCMHMILMLRGPVAVEFSYDSHSDRTDVNRQYLLCITENAGQAFFYSPSWQRKMPHRSCAWSMSFQLSHSIPYAILIKYRVSPQCMGPSSVFSSASLAHSRHMWLQLHNLVHANLHIGTYGRSTFCGSACGMGADATCEVNDP